MKKILKLTLVALAILVVQGCANHTKFVKKYDSWVGQNIAHLIGQIGYPDSTFVLPIFVFVAVIKYISFISNYNIN
jgi:hypothetical protein